MRQRKSEIEPCAFFELPPVDINLFVFIKTLNSAQWRYQFFNSVTMSPQSKVVPRDFMSEGIPDFPDQVKCPR